MMFGINTGASEVLKRIPKRSVGVEIGVWRGASSELFLERASHLHLVDPWSVAPYRAGNEFGDFQSYLKRYEKIVGSRNEASFQKYYDSVFKSVVKRFAGRPVTIHRMTSVEFFESFTDKVDWVYIDGLHDTDSCLHDLYGAMAISTSIFGDDYGVKPGVTEAVDRFIRETGLTLEVIGKGQYQI